MTAPSRLDLIHGDNHLAGNLFNGNPEGPSRINEYNRPQANPGYRQGRLHGVNTLFHPNDRVSAQLAFIDSRLHRPVSFHVTEDRLQRKVYYHNGLFHGKVLICLASGQVAEREHYRDGMRDEVYQRFHGSGQLVFDERYLSDQLLNGAQPFAGDSRPLDSEDGSVAHWH